ncbi:MAG: phosphoribosyltransferase family protein [Chloroflexi bacterium]|nr:phosphoribosyltransferase family protein [Chloroflexota bacterium]
MASAMTLLPAVLRKAIETILPSHCVGCGVGGTYLCDVCIGAIERPFPMTIAPDAYSFDSATSAFAYSDLARTAVHRLKFGGLRALAPLMALPMAACVPGATHADVIVAVPLHRSRLRGRGYNQAQLLADGVSTALGLPLRNDLLKRVQQGATQVGAHATERQANVRDAFEAAPQAYGLRILLVDDVTTTNATLDAAANALKKAGAAAVHGVTFARDL